MNPRAEHLNPLAAGKPRSIIGSRGVINRKAQEQ